MRHISITPPYSFWRNDHVDVHSGITIHSVAHYVSEQVFGHSVLHHIGEDVLCRHFRLIHIVFQDLSFNDIISEEFGVDGFRDRQILEIHQSPDVLFP
jgi:hypothetical protein